MLRNAELCNKIAREAASFAERVRCEEGDEPDVKAVREAFKELFAVWTGVDAAFVSDEEPEGV